MYLATSDSRPQHLTAETHEQREAAGSSNVGRWGREATSDYWSPLGERGPLDPRTTTKGRRGTRWKNTLRRTKSKCVCVCGGGRGGGEAKITALHKHWLSNYGERMKNTSSV